MEGQGEGEKEGELDAKDSSVITMNIKIEAKKVVNEIDPDPLPIDKFYLVYWILVLLGCTMLFPYNAIITAVDYFKAKFGEQVEFTLATVLLIFNTSTVGIMVIAGNFLPLSYTIIAPLIAYLGILVALPSLDHMSLGASLEFAITLCIVAMSAIAEGILQCSLYALAGLCPPVYTQATQMGTAISGSIICAIRILTKLLPIDVRATTLIYFVVCAVFVILSIVMVGMIMKLPFTLHYAGARLFTKSEDKMTNEAEVYQQETMEILQDLKKNLFVVSLEIWPHALGVCLDFIVTLFVFPAIVSSIKSASGPAYNDWLSILIITVFNVGDLIGKMMALNHHIKNLNLIQLYGILVFRVLFIPGFLYASQVGFSHDAVPLLLMAFFAVTNGICSVVFMMQGPSKLADRHKELGGRLMVFALLTGLAAGAVSAFPLQFILQ